MSADMERSNHQDDMLPVHFGVFRGGKVELERLVGWPEGQRVRVTLGSGCSGLDCSGPAVIVGFGPAGRCVAELLDKRLIPYAVVDWNPKTVITREELGKPAILGDVTDPAVLEAAGIRESRLLVLTIPDEKSTIRAIRSARLMNPSIVILARTEHMSTSLIARRVGANAVISAELAVAKEFTELLIANLPSVRTTNGQPGSCK